MTLCGSTSWVDPARARSYAHDDGVRQGQELVARMCVLHSGTRAHRMIMKGFEREATHESGHRHAVIDHRSGLVETRRPGRLLGRLPHPARARGAFHECDALSPAISSVDRG